MLLLWRLLPLPLALQQQVPQMLHDSCGLPLLLRQLGWLLRRLGRLLRRLGRLLWLLRLLGRLLQLLGRLLRQGAVATQLRMLQLQP